MMKKIVFCLIIVLVLVTSFFTFKYGKERFSKIDTKNNQVACTMEAKLCPDGSYVGRSGAMCEFSPCPNVIEKPGQDTSSVFKNGNVSLVVGKEESIGDLVMKVDSIIEDSRCPADVVCVWAGTVKIKLSLKNKSTLEEKVVTLDQNPYIFNDYRISLIETSPSTSSLKKILPKEYKFLLYVEKI